MPDLQDTAKPVTAAANLSASLAAVRFILLIPVLGCLVVAVVVLGFGAALVVKTAAGLLDRNAEISTTAGKALALTGIEIIDLFLIAAVAYITAVSLYTLFINQHVPAQLRLGIESLSDLKEKIVGVLVVALGVLFLGAAMNWSGGAELLFFGGAIAPMIAVLSYFIRHGEKPGSEP
jgi:uncharacterized membrane protein YqhA